MSLVSIATKLIAFAINIFGEEQTVQYSTNINNCFNCDLLTQVLQALNSAVKHAI